MPKPGTALALDYGKAKTGVAVGHPLTGSAQPLAPVASKSETQLLQGLAEVMKAWQPTQIVVGLPLSASGDDTPMSQTIKAFGDTLQREHPSVEVVFHDERLTSQAAASVHAHRRESGRSRARDAQKLDSVAAALILESWMREQQEVSCP